MRNIKVKIEPANLVTKLAEVCSTVGGIEKNGKNENQKYRYVKAADVAKAFRQELFKRKILLTSDEKNVSEQRLPTNSGGTIQLLTLTVEFTLRDGDSGETLTMTAHGMGMDTGDKAIYKAKTGALKYFLRGLGIVPDEKDDPEADETVDEETDPKVLEAKPKKNRKNEPVTQAQVRVFHAACGRTGKTTKQIDLYLRTKFDVLRLEDLAAVDFNEALIWAQQSASLEQQFAESVTVAKANGRERVIEPLEETA